MSSLPLKPTHFAPFQGSGRIHGPPDLSSRRTPTNCASRSRFPGSMVIFTRDLEPFRPLYVPNPAHFAPRSSPWIRVISTYPKPTHFAPEDPPADPWSSSPRDPPDDPQIPAPGSGGVQIYPNLMQSPTGWGQKYPLFGQKWAKNGPKWSKIGRFGPKTPHFGQKQPKIGGFEPKTPHFGPKTPHFGSKNPKMGSK